MIGVVIIKVKVPSAFKALNNHDLDGFLKNYYDDAIFEYPGDIAVSGIYQGKKVIKEWFRNFFDHFPEIDFEIKEVGISNPFDFMANNFITILWDVKLKNKRGEAFKQSGITTVKSRFGKSIYTKDFIFDTGDEFKRAWSD